MGQYESTNQLISHMASEFNKYSKYVALGRMSLGDGFYENALKEFTKAIELNPKDYEAYRHRARILWSKFKDFDSSEKDYKFLMETPYKTNEDVLWEMGIMYYNKKRFVCAIKSLSNDNKRRLWAVDDLKSKIFQKDLSKW
jgi:tetratricopeptide (TPR) repeat protein